MGSLTSAEPLVLLQTCVWPKWVIPKAEVSGTDDLGDGMPPRRLIKAVAGARYAAVRRSLPGPALEWRAGHLAVLIYVRRWHLCWF